MFRGLRLIYGRVYKLNNRMSNLLKGRKQIPDIEPDENYVTAIGMRILVIIETQRDLGVWMRLRFAELGHIL